MAVIERKTNESLSERETRIEALFKEDESWVEKYGLFPFSLGMAFTAFIVILMHFMAKG